MKVKDWISHEEAERDKYEEAPCGTFGGWFNFDEKDLRWKDYLAIWEPQVVPYIEAIRESVIRKGLRLTGEQHQYSSRGVPMFEDNTVGMYTYRGWGDLMAAIWSEEEDKDYNYMDFYM